MNKEQYIKEVETAFEIYELMKKHPSDSWYRIIQVTEAIRNEEIKKQYGQPVPMNVVPIDQGLR